MKTLAYNLRFLKMIFFGGPWLKISAVYCFVGFIIEAWGQQGYMENVMEKSLSSYTLVISALPAVILDGKGVSRQGVRKSQVDKKIYGCA